jgi:hypothetical protein
VSAVRLGKEITMQKLRSTKALAAVFFASGLYDLGGFFYFALLVGANRSIDDPPTHPFYAIFIASFLLCFAYLQLLSAFNMRRYLLIVGSVILGRLFYVVLLFACLSFLADFPATFLPTGIMDLVWSTLYLVLAWISDEVRVKDLFLPHRGDGQSA